MVFLFTLFLNVHFQYRWHHFDKQLIMLKKSQFFLLLTSFFSSRQWWWTLWLTIFYSSRQWWWILCLTDISIFKAHADFPSNFNIYTLHSFHFIKWNVSDEFHIKSVVSHSIFSALAFFLWSYYEDILLQTVTIFDADLWTTAITENLPNIA